MGKRNQQEFAASLDELERAAKRKARSRHRPVRSFTRDGALTDIRFAVDLAQYELRSQAKLTPAEAREAISELRHACKTARRYYQRARGNDAILEPLMWVLSPEVGSHDVDDQIDKITSTLEQHEKWFGRALLEMRVRRGRLKQSVLPEARLLERLIPIFESHTGLYPTRSATGFSRFFAAVVEESNFPTKSRNLEEYVRNRIRRYDRAKARDMTNSEQWADLPLGE